MIGDSWESDLEETRVHVVKVVVSAVGMVAALVAMDVLLWLTSDSNNEVGALMIAGVADLVVILLLVRWCLVWNGALVPVLLATAGLTASGAKCGLRGWSAGATLAFMALLLIASVAPAEFLPALIPIVPSLVFSGLAVWGRGDTQFDVPGPGHRVASDHGHDELGLVR